MVRGRTETAASEPPPPHPPSFFTRTVQFTRSATRTKQTHACMHDARGRKRSDGTGKKKTKVNLQYCSKETQRSEYVTAEYHI